MHYLVALLLSISAIGAEVKEQKIAMPGDDAFGFFHKGNYCRIRSTIRCSFVVAGTRARNQIIEIKIRNNRIRHRTDDEGILDVKFKCNKSLLNETVQFSTAKYKTTFV